MTMDAKEIEAAADALLSEAGISYTATLTQRGAKEPQADGKEWEHDAWLVTFTKDGRNFALPYKTGTGHRQDVPHSGAPYTRGTIAWAQWKAQAKCIAPKPADVLYSVAMEDTRGASFEEWAADYGYDTDSRKALAIYMQCQKQTDDARRFFGRELFERIASTVEGY